MTNVVHACAYRRAWTRGHLGIVQMVCITGDAHCNTDVVCVLVCHQLVTLSNLPSSASIDMPPVHIRAVLLQHDPLAKPDVESTSQTDDLAGLTVREGNYLKATADVGAFEHILTTDLLNHLVFVQKVFMKVIICCLSGALDVIWRHSSSTSISLLQHIRGVTTMRYINLHFTYLLLTYGILCDKL